MAAVRVRLLTEENSMSSRVQLRIFGSAQQKDIPGKNTWAKWSALAIDEHGDTILVQKPFFGLNQIKEMEQWSKQYVDGTVIDINHGAIKNSGCKGISKDCRYDSSMSKIALEFTNKSEVRILPGTNALAKKIPLRPKINQNLANIKEYKAERKVNVCGVVQILEASKLVKVPATSRQKEKDEDVAVLHLIDNTKTGADISLWDQLDKKFVDKIGKFVAIYNLKFKVTPNGQSMQTGHDTIIRFVEAPDGINPREDDMIRAAATLQKTECDQKATSYAGNGSRRLVEGPLRLVCVKALAHALDIRTDLPEAGFQAEGVICKLADRENLTVEGRLWTKLTLIDCSGQVTLFATEKALLALSDCEDATAFVKQVEDGSLKLPRACVRVSRSIKTLHSGTPQQTDVVNMIVEDATRRFLCNVVDDPENRFSDSSDFVDVSAVLPACAASVESMDDGFRVQYGNTKVDALAGCLLLLRATKDQEPDTMGNNAVLRYIGMEDMLDEGQSKTKRNLLSMIPLRHALKAQVSKGQYGLFHITGTLVQDNIDYYIAEKVYKPDEPMSEKEAITAFKAEILSATNVVQKRRPLKRERSHIDPLSEVELIKNVFTPDNKKRFMCQDLASPPARSN